MHARAVRIVIYSPMGRRISQVKSARKKKERESPPPPRVMTVTSCDVIFTSQVRRVRVHLRVHETVSLFYYLISLVGGQVLRDSPFLAVLTRACRARWIQKQAILA